MAHLIASNELIEAGLITVECNKADPAPLLSRYPGGTFNSGLGVTITLLNPANPIPFGSGCGHRVRLIGFHDENPGYGKTFEVRVGLDAFMVPLWTGTFALDAPKPQASAWRNEVWWWIVLPPDVPQDESIEIDVPGGLVSRRIFVGDYVDVSLNLEADWTDTFADVAEVQTSAPGASYTDGRLLYRRDRSFSLVGLDQLQVWGPAVQPLAFDGQHWACLDRIFDYAGQVGEIALLPRAEFGPPATPEASWPLIQFGVYGRLVRPGGFRWIGQRAQAAFEGDTRDLWSTDKLTVRALR